MSDLTWTEMPEVDPEQPDELVLDFSGEIHRVAPADTFVIGRGGDLDIDDNPYLHRRFLVFAHSENLWWIANEGSRLSATLTDGEGLVQSRLAPGARPPTRSTSSPPGRTVSPGSTACVSPPDRPPSG